MTSRYCLPDALAAVLRTSSSRVLVRVAVPPAEPDSAIVALVTSTARTVELAELSATAPSSSCWPRPAAKDAANPMNDPA